MFNPSEEHKNVIGIVLEYRIYFSPFCKIPFYPIISSKHQKEFGINLPIFEPLCRLNHPSLSLTPVMELFQELVFTISFSLIVSLLIAKIFSVATSCDDETSTISRRVEEKIEKEWIVCDSETEEKGGYFEDAVKVSEDVVCESVEAEFGSGCVIEGTKSVGGVDASFVFDESPERTESKDTDVSLVKSDESNDGNSTGSLTEEDCMRSIEVQQESSAIDGGEVKIDASYVFDESPERTESTYTDVSLVKSDAGNAGNSMGSLTEEDCMRSIEVQQESSAIDGDEVKIDTSYVFNESPGRTESKDTDISVVKSNEGNVGNSTGSSTEEDCVKSVEVQQESSAIDGSELKIEDEDRIFDDDWQGIETTALEKSFGAAVAFMGSKSSVDRVSLIDYEVKMQLYGLHKVAIEGACFEPQPMALKVSARANWNAWKRLENLGREDAMEQYIALISRHVPDWMGSHASEDDAEDFIATGASMTIKDSNMITKGKQ